jgi:2-oxoacid:acceptor oxidoreductase, beta subunit, pyruvate/2-ketoisovalerate family
MTISLKDLDPHEMNDWCPGCGDNGILAALKNTIVNLNLDPHKMVVVSGIGCSSKLPNFINTNGVHTLHGRPIPFAEGIKLANPDLTVVIDSGDGDTYGIGMGHFISAGRRNVDIKLFVHDNGVYSLTKGQASPTLPENRKVKGIPEPNINGAINPLQLALFSGYTFIARTTSYNIKEQVDLMSKAIKHKGLALVDILQGCPTYNSEFTSSQWFLQHTKPLPQTYDPLVKNPADMREVKQKKKDALSMMMEDDDMSIHTGVFFQWENPDTFENRLQNRGIPSPLSQQIADKDNNSTIDLAKTLGSLIV